MALDRRLASAVVYAVFGTVMLCAYTFTGDALVQAVVYSAMGAVAAVAIWLGLLRSSGATKSWLAIGASMACWSAADTVWFSIDVNGDVPYPSLAEPLYLLGYVLLAAGLVGIAFAGRRTIAVATDLIDVSIISVCVGLIAWPFVFEPTLEDGWTGPAAVTVAYAGGDIVLLGLLAALIFNPSKRAAAMFLLGGSVVAVFIADVLFYVPTFASSAAVDLWSSQAWMVGYILVGMAGLLRGQPEKRRARDSRSSISRVSFVGAALLALPSTLALDAVVGDGIEEGEWKVFASGFVVVIALVIARSLVLIRQIDGSHAQTKQMSVRLQSVFDNAGVGMIIRTSDNLNETNSAFQAMLGYTADELASMSYLDLVHPEEVDAARSPIDLSVGGRASLDRRYIHRDGSTVLGRMTFTKPDENLTIAIVEDITTKAKKEQQLQESQRLEAVGRLAGGIAHDFNNLLTAVIGHAQLIGKTEDPTEIAESAGVIVDAGERAASLTKQLLAFSRRQEISPVQIQSAELLLHTTDLIRRLLGGSINVQVEVDEKAPAIVADPSQIDQVLMNLAVNARDAMPDGGTLLLAVGPYRQLEDDRTYGIPAGDYCRFLVSDTGHGMDQQTISRMFEPFFTTKDVGKGTGLGLATTHGIITQAGGHIRVTSRLEVGTAFEVLLPSAPPLPSTTRRTAVAA